MAWRSAKGEFHERAREAVRWSTFALSFRAAKLSEGAEAQRRLEDAATNCDLLATEALQALGYAQQ